GRAGRGACESYSVFAPRWGSSPHPKYLEFPQREAVLGGAGLAIDLHVTPLRLQAGIIQPAGLGIAGHGFDDGPITFVVRYGYGVIFPCRRFPVQLDLADLF